MVLRNVNGVFLNGGVKRRVVQKFAVCDKKSYCISETVQDRANVTIEH